MRPTDEQRRQRQRAYHAALLLPAAAKHLGLSLEETRAIWEEIEAGLPELEAAYLKTRFAALTRAERST